MRFLFIDDSGKPDPKDHSKVLAFAGFSLDEADFHSFRRQVTGAKKNFFPGRGHPEHWEVKSTDFLPSNHWHKKNNRDFCNEILNILQRFSCSVFVALAVKANATQPLAEDWIVPLLVQRIALKFHAEVVGKGTTGMILCDWSSYKLDRHISSCVSSLVTTRKMAELRGGVMYGSSSANPPLQVADLIAGTFRRHAEGQGHLTAFRNQLFALKYVRHGYVDAEKFPVDSIVQVF